MVAALPCTVGNHRFIRLRVDIVGAKSWHPMGGSHDFQHVDRYGKCKFISTRVIRLLLTDFSTQSTNPQ